MAKQSDQEQLLVQVKDLKKHFPVQRGFLRRTIANVKAVDGVSFEIRRGETLGLVGESGCGKTTTGRLILRAYEPTGGQILFQEAGHWLDVAAQDQKGLKVMRQKMQMIFQDPYSSLNARMTLQEIVGEPLLVNGVARGKALEDRVAQLLQQVGLPAEYMRRYPHAFSGGQRQRIGIARALALNPKFIVADEPVSALDVSVQAQILNLLQDLQEELELTYLFIAHDLSVVEHISDRVAVMYVGRLVEVADTAELFGQPRHPYTEALMSAVPKPDPRARKERIVLQGEIADASNPPAGCYFHPRCRYCQDVCRLKTPELTQISPAHLVSCHRAAELTLAGVVV